MLVRLVLEILDLIADPKEHPQLPPTCTMQEDYR